jgi:hypothetical protein
MAGQVEKRRLTMRSTTVAQVFDRTKKTIDGVGDNLAQLELIEKMFVEFIITPEFDGIQCPSVQATLLEYTRAAIEFAQNPSAFVHQDVADGNAFAELERRQEARAFLSDPDYARFVR